MGPILPFDVGRIRDRDLNLDTEEGRLAFDGVHGPARSRRDAQDVFWNLDPRAYHGGDSLLIRGASLPTGCHWDVEIKRGSAHVFMAAEVWKLKQGQYLNVYPDMHSRTTRQGARKVWPKNT